MEQLTLTFSVQPTHSAKAVGSGSLEVLSTPMLTAYMEETAAQLLSQTIASGQRSVGTYLEIKHLKASAIGSHIEIVATLTEATPHKAQFDIIAHQNGILIGTAEHTRAIVEIERFERSILS